MEMNSTNAQQAEFLYKVKPKLQNQFKAAEAGGVPFALILGEVRTSLRSHPHPVQTVNIVYQDELAQGKAKLKEMGLPEDHPLKEGELINLDNLAEEVQLRLTRKEQLDSITQQAEGLKVVDGIKGEDIKAEEIKAAVETA
jgi:histidyl-tRNA synthetase